METYTEITEKQVLHAQLVFESAMFSEFKAQDERACGMNSSFKAEKAAAITRLDGLLDRLLELNTEEMVADYGE